MGKCKFEEVSSPGAARPPPKKCKKGFFGKGRKGFINKNVVRADGFGYAHHKFCFPSHKHIANKIGASISSVQRGIRELIKLNLVRKGRQRYHNLYYLLKLDRSVRPTSNKLGQSDQHIGHTDRSDQSAGTTNKNKEKDLNKKNYVVDEKTVDNLEKMKKLLVDKMSMNDGKKR